MLRQPPQSCLRVTLYQMLSAASFAGCVASQVLMPPTLRRSAHYRRTAKMLILPAIDAFFR